MLETFNDIFSIPDSRGSFCFGVGVSYIGSINSFVLASNLIVFCFSVWAFRE